MKILPRYKVKTEGEAVCTYVHSRTHARTHIYMQMQRHTVLQCLSCSHSLGSATSESAF